MRTAEQLRYLVLAAQLEGRRQWARMLRPLGLTPSQAEVLRVVEDFGPLSIGTLGALLVCESGTNPSRLVDRLVSHGVLDRRRDLTDARVVVLTVSAAGRELARAVAGLEEVMYEHLDSVTGPDADAAIAFLRRYLTGTGSGEAFTRRLGGPTSPPPSSSGDVLPTLGDPPPTSGDVPPMSGDVPPMSGVVR